MLRSIFFGPSSLNNEGKKPNAPKTNGKLWGISQVTPGAIVAVSVFVSIINCSIWIIFHLLNIIINRLSTSIHAMNNFDQSAQRPRSTIKKFSTNWRQSSSVTHILHHIRNSSHGSISLYSIGRDQMLKVLTVILRTRTVGSKRLYCKWMYSTLKMTTTTQPTQEDLDPARR